MAAAPPPLRAAVLRDTAEPRQPGSPAPCGLCPGWLCCPSTAGRRAEVRCRRPVPHGGSRLCRRASPPAMLPGHRRPRAPRRALPTPRGAGHSSPVHSPALPPLRPAGVPLRPLPPSGPAVGRGGRAGGAQGGTAGSAARGGRTGPASSTLSLPLFLVSDSKAAAVFPPGGSGATSVGPRGSSLGQDLSRTWRWGVGTVPGEV